MPVSYLSDLSQSDSRPAIARSLAVSATCPSVLLLRLSVGLRVAVSPYPSAHPVGDQSSAPTNGRVDQPSGPPSATVTNEHGPGKARDVTAARQWDVIASDFEDLASQLGC